MKSRLFYCVLAVVCVLPGSAAVLGSRLQVKLSGPILGYVWSNAGGTFRPLQGMLGNATIGAPVDPGLAITQAFAVDGRHFLASTDARTSLVVLNADTEPFAVTPVADAPSYPSLVSVSRKGLAVALYYAPQGQVRIVSGLPSSPKVVYTIDGSPDVKEVVRMAVSDDGNLLIFVVSQPDQDMIYAWTPASGNKLLTIADRVSDIALMKNGDTIIADEKANQVFSIIDPAGAAARFILADDRNGVSNPASVAVSDANRIYVASADGTIMTLDSTGQLLRSLKCSCRPSGLYPISDSVYRLSDQTDRTIYLLKTDAAGDRVVFVPLFSDGK